MLDYDLQLFAKDGPGGEKTEEPTAKKLEDARKEGQVAKSKELSLGFGLLAMFILLKIYVSLLGEQFMDLFSIVYNRIPELTTFVSGKIPTWDYFNFFRYILLRAVLLMIPFMLIALAVGVVVEIAQVKWAPTTKPLQPKFNKMNPISGFKRIFSVQSLVEFLKSLLKIGLIVWIVYSTMRDNWGIIFRFLDMPVEQTIAQIGELVINLGIKLALFYLIIAFADFLFQKWKFKQDMMMTKQEVKDEFKQAEGDPQIKGKIRQKMMQISRQRMMQDIPKADVVITNPTHFAVALKYDPALFPAPYVVAKGTDHLAAKIKEVARENNVEIVENKPLARSLYANVQIGEVITEDLYKAVADILAMVYKMQGKV